MLANAIRDDPMPMGLNLTLLAVAENDLRCAALKMDRETWRVANIVAVCRG